MNLIERAKAFLKGDCDAKRDGKIIFGGKRRESVILHRIPAVCEQALSDICHIGMLAQACALERSRDIGAMSEDPIRRESNALIAAAKAVGCVIEPSSVRGTRYTIRTGESEVRLDQANRIYYKIKNPFAKLHLKKHSVEFVLYEHVVHNILFPDCRLEFLGVAEDCHEARLVFRQRAIRAVARPDDGQIAAALRDLGLMPEGRYCFGNELVFVTDVGQDGDNVLVDAENQLRFVDPIIGFKEPLLPLLTEQTVVSLVRGLYKVANEYSPGA